MLLIGSWARRGVLPVVAVVLIVAGCGSSGKHSASPAASSRLAPSGSASSTSEVPSPTTITTVAGTSTTATSDTGPLSVVGKISIPGVTDDPVATEAPDGAVFVSDFSANTDSPTVVWVIDGAQPAVVAEHVPIGISGLVADSSSLYVASDSSVIRYDRASGAQAAEWRFPAPDIGTASPSNAHLVSLAVSNDSVYVFVAEGAAAGGVDVYLGPSSGSGSPSLLFSSQAGAAVGPDGSLYHERSDDHLVRTAPDGVVTVGPSLGVPPDSILTVAAGILWVQEVQGQGVGALYRSFDASTLAPLGTYQGVDGESSLTDTVAGPIDAPGSYGPKSCPDSDGCVFRFSANATLADPLPVGDAYQVLGPQPAVIVTNTAGTAELDRLG
jgi:hypothetical protein